MKRYSVGDEVVFTPKTIKATIIRVLGNDTYTVEWHDKELIPPQMDIDGFYLAPELPHRKTLDGWGVMPENTINKETHCPKCGTPWTETPIGKNLFYDCLKCNLKKEDA